MKPSSLLPLSLLSVGFAFSLGSARADDAANPPPPPAPATQDTSPGDGQTPPAHHRRMHPAFVLGELTAKLNLTPEQQKTVGSIIANNDSQLKTLRQDDSVAKEDKRTKMKAIIEATRGQIRAALTPDQQQVFDTLPTRGQRGGNPPPATTPPAPPPPTT
jgi:hypothetical protein